MSDKPVIEPEYGDERWLEAVSGVPRSTWQKRRMSGRDGPPFVKLGHAVIYHKATTLAWIAARTQTREPQAAYPVTPQNRSVPGRKMPGRAPDFTPRK